MDAQKLKGYIVEKKKTYADCAKATNMSVTAFSNKMNGISAFDIIEINALIVFLEMPISLAVEIFFTFNLA